MKDIRALTECDVQALIDTFFNFVAFDHNNSRLAPIQGEIRVGASYQVTYLFTGIHFDDKVYLFKYVYNFTRGYLR